MLKKNRLARSAGGPKAPPARKSQVSHKGQGKRITGKDGESYEAKRDHRPRRARLSGSTKVPPPILPFHPLADIFPLLEGRDFDALAASIKDSNGPYENIILHEGMILDGRNRARACEILGLKPKYSVLPDTIDPLTFVLDRNLHRRHLDDRQRASVAGKIANVSRGGDRSKPPIGGLSVEKSAEVLNVAPRQVERARVVHQHGGPEVRQALDRGEIAVSVAEDIARLPVQEQPAAIAQATLPNGARAIMASRREPSNSLDNSPTPPWATRAMLERVLPAMHVSRASLTSVHDPCCGDGLMAEVLREYFPAVTATDIYDYGYGSVQDFLADDFEVDADWIAMNPPFKDKAEKFALKAIDQARVGVAMFAQLRWLETIGRYERLFRDRPPTQIAFFCERVNLCMGRWEPLGTTATAYIWLVWMKGRSPRAPFWIPPGCRETLTKPDDRERFTAHPVIKKQHIIETVANGPTAVRDEEPACAVAPQPPAHAGSPITEDHPLDIPDFLRIGHPACSWRTLK
ncbi:MAG: hypothetical protein P4M05_10130 [Bradyrhizobium sp.]|nr:hypothetical protein [Bradyrhizobium sp.]